MARTQQDYDDIPGTFVFDAERSRQGYHLNMFCMSLMKAENRKAFKEDEAKYLDRFPLTPEQREAILKRDYNRMLELGGNIYFTAKLGATDGHSFQHIAAVMTGSTQEDYAKMMLGGGRSVEGNRSKSGKSDKPAKSKPGKSKVARRAANRDRNVARIIAGVSSSHVPAIGAAIDNKQTEEPYWKRVFSGFEKSKEWMAKAKPDVVIVIYNDHASAFSVEMIPTFALGCAAEFPPADEGWGPRPVPVVQGPSRARLAHRPVGHPRRVRPHHRQQDGGRSRPHRAAQPAVRLAEGMAVPGHSARRQRRAVSAADRASLLHAGQGDPQGGRVLSRGPARS